ncbi:unnamed protein product [Adineta steineri]|uniref:Uncharacterized protein n=1 Tax=Adineta steineri TaxID=433720 RepID=A0A814H6E5_9BILA|nr:unnamed protein product [Adineta steineri]CAF4089429.1 unnamed protein product [Adineta steineri]
MHHTVRIRDLSPVPASQTGHRKGPSQVSTNHWIEAVDKLCLKSPSDRYKVQYWSENGPHTHADHSGHPVFEAFYTAYCNHEDIILSPDDIWLMITIYYAKYVDENAEQLRSLFVDHEGKKTLEIIIPSETPDWPTFLEEMKSKIGENVKNDVVEVLQSAYSTTGQVESLLSCACIMHTFKKYFDYRHIYIGCGIRNVHFLGTLADWQLLRSKAEKLKSFTIPSKTSSKYQYNNFSAYIDGVLPILDEFIRTYQGQVDNKFWDQIFDYTHVHKIGGSGMILGEVPGIRGWFLRLCYGFHHSEAKVEAEDLQLNAISVPVTLINLTTQQKSSCYVAGGFHGVHSQDGKHKPVISLSVIEDTKPQEELSSDLLDLLNDAME